MEVALGTTMNHINRDLRNLRKLGRVSTAHGAGYAQEAVAKCFLDLTESVFPEGHWLVSSVMLQTSHWLILMARSSRSHGHWTAVFGGRTGPPWQNYHFRR